jgi:hypothetical protein
MKARQVTSEESDGNRPFARGVTTKITRIDVTALQARTEGFRTLSDFGSGIYRVPLAINLNANGRKAQSKWN